MKADIKLTRKEVEEIIRAHIQCTTNHAVSAVRFDIEPGYSDPREYSSPSLREVIVSVELG